MIQTNISQLKAAEETRIASLPPIKKAAAKAIWNRTIDGIKALLVAKLSKFSALKLLDAKNIAKLGAASAAIKGAASTKKADIQKPSKDLLGTSDAKATADLRSSVDGLTKDESAKGRVLGNNALRAKVCSDKKDLEIVDLQKNITSLDSLKF